VIAESWIGSSADASVGLAADRAAADAILDRWEVQLESALGRLVALRRKLEDQAGRLGGLERDLARPDHPARGV